MTDEIVYIWSKRHDDLTYYTLWDDGHREVNTSIPHIVTLAGRRVRCFRSILSKFEVCNIESQADVIFLLTLSRVLGLLCSQTD